MVQLPLFKTIKSILLIILIPAAFIMPLLLIAQPSHPLAVSQGWQYKYGDSPKSDQGIPLWVNDSVDDNAWKPFSYPGQPPVSSESRNVWLRTQLPDKDFKIPSIMFTTNDQLFEVYLEDKLIYNYGDVEHHTDKVAPGSPWHLIPLPEDYQGKTIYLRMHTPSSRNLGLVRRFEIGSETEHLSYLIANEIDNLLLTFLFTFLGLCLIFIFAVRRSVHYEFPALGIFSISIGVWLLAETNFKQLFLYAPRFWLYVAFLSFYLMPVGFLVFVERVFSPGNTYMRMMWKLHIVFAAATLLLDVTRLLPFIFTLQAFYVVLFLSVVTIFATISKAARANSYETKIFVTGFSIFILFGFYDILGMYFRIVPWSQYIIPYGMLMFLLSMIYILGMRFADVYDKMKLFSEDIKAKNEALQQAYIEVNTSRDKLKDWNKGLEQTVQKRTTSIRNLLDNAGQGFLTFGHDLCVDPEFSSECNNIFNCSIEGKSFPELIYPDNAEEQDFLTTLLGKILEEKREAQRNIYITLLPEEISIGSKRIHISYKLIQDKYLRHSEIVMIILTDITYKRMLEDKVEQERNVLKMVVKVITNYEDFTDTVREFREFCRYTLPGLLNTVQPVSEAIYDIYRMVHNFKGTFCLFETSNMIKKLHSFEDKISELKDCQGSSALNSIREYLSENDIEGWLEADISILKDILGDKFLNREDSILIGKDRLLAIEEKMLMLLPSAESRLLLPDIRKLRHNPFKEVLKGLPEYAQRLADRMDKLIYPVEIMSDNIFVDLDRYQGFSKALIHVFRNIVDHGLETADERQQSGKPEYCRISCEIKLMDDSITLTISDDGRGFDFNKIRQTLILRGIIEEEAACSLTDNEAVRIMIENRVSTKEDVTYTSGRGLGISLVKDETEKLGGTFTLTTEMGKGTKFKFRFPYASEVVITGLKASSIIDPLVETAKDFIVATLKCESISFNRSSFSRCDSLSLKDFTCFIDIKGVVYGKFVATMDRGLAEKLLEHLLIDKLPDEEMEAYIEDILAECSNIILGNSIKKFPGLENSIAMDPPVILKLTGAVLRYMDSSVWNCSIASEYGSMTISFIVPFDSSLDKEN